MDSRRQTGGAAVAGEGEETGVAPASRVAASSIAPVVCFVLVMLTIAVAADVDWEAMLGRLAHQSDWCRCTVSCGRMEIVSSGVGGAA